MAGDADIVLVDGKVFTAARDRPWARALAVRGDRIVAAGTSAQAERWAGPKTRTVDLRGRVVVPGFIDAHAHMADSAGELAWTKLDRARSLEDAIARVRDAPDLSDEAPDRCGSHDRPGGRVATPRSDQDFLRRFPGGVHGGTGRAVRRPAVREGNARSHADGTAIAPGGGPSRGIPDSDPRNRRCGGPPRRRDAGGDPGGAPEEGRSTSDRALRTPRGRRAPADEGRGAHRLLPAELHRAMERPRGRLRDAPREGPRDDEQPVPQDPPPTHPAVLRLRRHAVRPDVRNPLGRERILRGPANLSGRGGPRGGRRWCVRVVRGTPQGDPHAGEARGLRD